MREGFTFAEAVGGREVALRLARDDPAAITLDITMPDLMAGRYSRPSRATRRWRISPSFLLTIVDEKNRGFALGASEYLVGPIDRDKLIRVLRRLCSPSGGSILVVDDDEISRGGLKNALQPAGWKVAEADNGQIALTRLNEGVR